VKRNVKRKAKHIIYGFKTAVTLTSVLLLVSCAGKNAVNTDGSFNLGNDEFFQDTRLIMSRREIKTYKHLPDDEARKAFIEEFWAKRDPNPETSENEARIEFENRIEVIDRWFSEKTGKSRGVDSDRGKVFLFLGPPDERSVDQRITYRSGIPITIPVETWVYHRHRLFLEFVDNKDFGEFRLTYWTPQLLTAIKQDKFPVYTEKKETGALKFKAKYKNGSIYIQLPVKEITFDEKDGKMNVTFKVSISVYRDDKKTDQVDVTREVVEAKETILKKDFIEINVPYTTALKGKLSFDIVVEDPASKSSYRKLIRH